MQRIAFNITADETACSIGKDRCRFMNSSHFGQRFWCQIFPGIELCDENGQPSGPGRLQRLPECRAAVEAIR